MPDALRGDVWAASSEFGDHPFVIISASSMHRHLSRCTGVVVTGSPGPDVTHVPLGPDSGLTEYAESYADCTDVHSVLHHGLITQLGRVSPTELAAISERLTRYLGF